MPPGGPNDVFGIQMVGNTIIQWGTEEQKRHFLPRILSGEDMWCQGYSEPNAGSDLGNLGCRAELDGDEWVINGQKIWTSAGHLANWIFVLTRTDPDAPPSTRASRSCSCRWTSPASRCGPIKMISGETEFNEVFFTDARAPGENVVGEVNGGWGVAMTLLGYERGEAARHHSRSCSAPSSTGCWRWPTSGARPTTRSSASGWRGATRRSRSCATSACAP